MEANLSWQNGLEHSQHFQIIMEISVMWSNCGWLNMTSNVKCIFAKLSEGCLCFFLPFPHLNCGREKN